MHSTVYFIATPDSIEISMVVRIRFARGPLVRKGRVKNANSLQIAPTLLTLVSIGSTLMGVWKVSADMGWAQAFAIDSGAFSHAQVWLALGAATQAGSWRLSRFARDWQPQRVAPMPVESETSPKQAAAAS
jgi:hypothetical protein